jgi:PleD family two-component response regulator
MQRNFYGFDPSYHVARHHFVHRKPHAWTPRHLALHRDERRPPASLPPTAADDRPLVLLVDDEVRSQEAMRRTLDEDFRVLTASGPTRRAGCWSAPGDVILCDQRMPG